MKKKRDHYSTLGVGKDAEPEQIKRAYRKRAKEAHPDTVTGSTEAFRERTNRSGAGGCVNRLK